MSKLGGGSRGIKHYKAAPAGGEQYEGRPEEGPEGWQA